MDGLWNIIINHLYKEDSTELINRNYSVKSKTGQDAEEKVKNLLEEMQKAIDDYKNEQNVLASAALDTAVTWLQNNLVG